MNTVAAPIDWYATERDFVTDDLSRDPVIVIRADQEAIEQLMRDMADPLTVWPGERPRIGRSEGKVEETRRRNIELWIWRALGLWGLFVTALVVWGAAQG